MRRVLIGLILAACGAPDESGSDGTTGPATCEHGDYSACACPDGSIGMQLCAHDTSGFEPCVCGGETTDDDAPQSTSDADAGDATSVADESTTTTSAATTSSSTSDSTSEAGPIGAPPIAMIDHPGGEDRQAGVAIPFIGVAMDPEDGPLAGDSMIWTDDLEGMIGEGEQFDAVLDVVGDHTVTLTATDSDGNVGTATLQFAIVP